MEQFARLLGGCQRQVFLYALGLLHNTADAEEVLQETNMVLWRKFDQYQPDTDFGGWARRIAHFEVLKLRDKRRAGAHVFSGDFIESLAAASDRAADVLEARRTALAHCLEKLADRDRQLLAMRYEEHAKTDSVAQALGRSIQGVRKSLHRIRTVLLTCVERTLAAEQRA
jgi:RNA polymerase sigma-70 factor (ECF subfamily)